MHEHEAYMKILANKGYCPSDVLDIGAGTGTWSVSAREFFPLSRFWMFDAQPNLENQLRETAANIKAYYDIVLLGAENKKDVLFYQMPFDNNSGSSLFPETSFVPFRPTSVQVYFPMRRLDDILEALDIKQGSFFIKLDVQGGELEVLKGAPRTLSCSEFVLMEVAHVSYNEGAPLMSEVIEFMHARDFIFHSVWEEHYRLSDRVLFQSDFLFACKDSRFR